jgi:hypothetical protein
MIENLEKEGTILPAIVKTVFKIKDVFGKFKNPDSDNYENYLLASDLAQRKGLIRENFDFTEGDF